MSQLSADDLRFAVMSGDAKAISAAQGIGKKTAEKLILELKDKLSMPDLDRYAALEDTSAVSAATGGIQQDAVSALVALGYGNTEALKAVRRVELTEGMNVEDVLKQAFKYMMFYQQRGIMGRRIITTENLEEDQKIENHLRPQTLDDYVGQEKAKEMLKIYISAAKDREEPLDHVLFYGPPGLGKTTLAGIIANEMGVNLKVTSGPAIEKPGDMAAILNSLQEGDVLFVDEIHRLNRQVEEVLYPAMEDFAIDIMIGKGASARSIRLDLPKFTLVGATTRAGMLTAPLRDRFGVINRLEFYTVEELQTIIQRSATVLGVEIDERGSAELARRSRGTPRLANRLLKRVRDFAQVKFDGVITGDVADFALDLLDVDKYGLDHVDRNLLSTMITRFAGGPVGLETLAASIGEDAGTIEDVYEPYLLKNGFLLRTPRGRVATELAYGHLGISLSK